MSLGIRMEWPITWHTRFDNYEGIFDKHIVLNVSNVKLNEEEKCLEMDLKMLYNKKMEIQDVSYVNIKCTDVKVEDAQYSCTTIISLGEYGLLVIRYKCFIYEIYKDTQDIRQGKVCLK